MSTGSPVLGIILVLALLGLYFLPCIIGGVRNKAHGGFGIFILNLCLGWTVIGWFVALIWASSGTTKKELRAQEQRHHELMMVIGGRK